MHALSWNEIKSRALEFSREWAGETSEDACYGKTAFESEAKRMAFLFELYDPYTKGLFPATNTNSGCFLKK